MRAGIDVGGTKVLGVLVDGDPGAEVVVARVRAASRRGPDGVVASVADAVGELCAQVGADPLSLVAVGVGVPGVVDPDAGTVTHAVNLGLDAPVDLARLVSDRLGGVRVRVENDLNTAALGAAALLHLEQRDLAFLAIGTGLAAGLLLDGRLRRGSSRAAGEIGHVPYRLDGPVCACGQLGCLEVYASGRTLELAWQRRPGSALADDGRPAPALVAAAAAAGEPWAVEAFATFVDAVAAAVRVLVLTCDVAHVVLGGGVAGLGDALLTPVVAALGAQAEHSPFLASLDIGRRVQIVPPGTDPAAVGAALATVAETTTSTKEATAWRS